MKKDPEEIKENVLHTAHILNCGIHFQGAGMAVKLHSVKSRLWGKNEWMIKPYMIICYKGYMGLFTSWDVNFQLPSFWKQSIACF